MAFDPENMGVVGYCNGFTLWYYASATDTRATIIGDGYFTAFASELSSEDMIIYTDYIGRTGFRRVNSVSPTMVTTASPV